MSKTLLDLHGWIVVVPFFNLSPTAGEKLGVGIEYVVHLRASKYSPRDVELFLFNIHTFSGVHEIIEDTLDLHVALEPATPQESNAKMEFKLNPPHQKLMVQRLQW